MNKKNRLVVGFVIGIIVLFVILMAKQGGLPFFVVPSDLTQDVGDCLGGFRPLSISNIEKVGDGDRIRIFASAGKGSECLAIKFTKSELQQKLEGSGLVANEDIDLGSINLVHATKVFPIDAERDPETGQNIFFKALRTNQLLSNSKSKSATIDLCKQTYPDTIFAYKPIPLTTDVRCVRTSDNGIQGGFQNSRVYGDFKVQVKIKGETAEISRDEQGVTLGGGKAIVKWSGNMVNFDEISVPQYKARLIQSKWILISSNTYTNYKTSLDRLTTCMEGKQSSFRLLGVSIGRYVSDKAYDVCAEEFNKNTANIYADQIINYKDSSANLIYDAETDSNSLYVSLKDNARPIPTFIIDLDASYVGVIPLKGKPVITQCVSKQSLNSGSNKVVQYTIKNDASNVATFNAQISCGEGVQPYDSSFEIGKNQELTKTIELIPSNPNTEKITDNCKLVVKDSESSNQDECSFDYSVSYVSGITCEPDSLVCDDSNKNVLKCTSDGKNKKLFEECPNGCGIKKGEAYCKDKEVKEVLKVGFFQKIWDAISGFFKNLFGGVLSFFTLLKYFVILIASGLTGFATNDILKDKIRTLRNKKAVRIIFALIVAVMVGVLLYSFIYGTLFWIILVLVGLYYFFVGRISKVVKGLRG